ncbi:MAG: hypothetical protein M0031_13100 [Thermaerobacter sp.]|jgi:hypothetical protein|nr:hypothetical protein [Thermaerobacter sp.]
MPNTSERASEADPVLETRAFQTIIQQARLVRAMPGLLARALDASPDAVPAAIRAWAANSRPLADIAKELMRLLGEG